MNVLYVCADRGIPVLGSKGASVHVRSITSAIQQLGHRVTLVARRWDAGNPAPRLYRLERLPSEPDDAVAMIEKLIRVERPDVVIERYSLQSGAARSATCRHDLPLMLEVNAPLVLEATRYRGLDDPTAEHREHESFRAADRIQVVSSALARYVRSVAPEVPLAWIPNGADTSAFRAAATEMIQGVQAQTTVGFVGSLKPWHGVEQLLDAFAMVHPRHPDARLLIVGTGGDEAKLRERAARADLRDQVIWTGQVPHSRVPLLLASFDLAVAPYLPAEQFYFDPLKVVEYLAAGKPVIHPRLGDLPALVGPAGLSYTPGSVDHLAERLEQALGDSSLRRRLSASAASAARRLDWSITARRVLRFATGEAVDQTSGGVPAGMA